MCECLWRPEEVCPGAGVPGGCELPNLGAGNQTEVLLEEQQALSTTKLDLQPLVCLFVLPSPHSYLTPHPPRRKYLYVYVTLAVLGFNM